MIFRLPDFTPTKTIMVLLIGLSIILYVGFNIWVFSGNINFAKIPLPSFSKNTSKSNHLPIVPAVIPTLTTATPTPILTPTPLQGPGKYACDPNGICKDYSDEMRKNCTATFADRNCLGQCANPAKKCTN